MKSLILSLLVCSVIALGATPDSMRTSPANTEVRATDTTAGQVQQADSVRQSTSTAQTWVVPLILVVAVGTSFFLLFTLRSR